MGESSRVGTLGVPIPVNEEERLAALRSYGILDTQPEPVFDNLTDAAAAVFSAPMALVSLVDKDRQWFKSAFGIEVQQIPRRESFCAHAIIDDPVMVVPDATKDPRFAENPLVTGEPFIRFYAGAPLITAEGFRIGTLCIVDTKVRPEGPTRKELAILRSLAAVAVHEIETGRRTSREFAELRQQAGEAGAAKNADGEVKRREGIACGPGIAGGSDGRDENRA